MDLESARHYDFRYSQLMGDIKGEVPKHSVRETLSNDARFVDIMDRASRLVSTEGVTKHMVSFKRVEGFVPATGSSASFTVSLDTEFLTDAHGFFAPAVERVVARWQSSSGMRVEEAVSGIELMDTSAMDEDIARRLGLLEDTLAVIETHPKAIQG